VIDEFAKIRVQNFWGEKSPNEMTLENVNDIFLEGGLLEKLDEPNVIAGKLAYTLGDEFFRAYRNFEYICVGYTEKLSETDFTDQDFEEVNLEVISSAGKLHSMLADRIISLQDEFQ
jgi:hypothetical protein